MLRSLLSAVLLTALCVPAAFSQAQQNPPAPPPPAHQRQQPPTITTRVDLVSLSFTVMNRRQKLVTDLERENFKVLENGEEQKISFFGRGTNLPLRVGIMLDTSNSIRDRFSFEQEAAMDFITSVIRRKKDLAFLMTFDSEAGLIVDYTDDANKLSEAIRKQRPGGGTSLYDAMHYACSQRLINAPLAPGPNPEVRRVLIVLSDGDDNQSSHARSEALDICQRAEVAIYTISTSTAGTWHTTDKVSETVLTREKLHKTDGDRTLDQFAQETGGRAFFPYRTDDMAQSFMDIGEELRSQYSLAYTPSKRFTDSRFRAIKIEVDRKGVSVRTRKGYYPGATQPTPPPAL